MTNATVQVNGGPPTPVRAWNIGNNQVLIGYQGPAFMDAGYFFCPYVPLTTTPPVLDPDQFTPRRGILTRYGANLLRDGAQYYRRLSITGFIDDEVEENDIVERLDKRDLINPGHLKYDPKHGF